MSMISSTFSRHESVAGAYLRRFGSRLRGWWVVYMHWRVEQLAITQLRGMSDRELQDIGIARAEIESAVKREPGRDYIYRRYY